MINELLSVDTYSFAFIVIEKNTHERHLFFSVEKVPFKVTHY